MQDRTSHDIALALLEHLRTRERDSETTFWAWECVQDMIDAGKAHEAWAIIRAAIESASTRRDLDLIGAGVLESLLVNLGDFIIDDLEAAATDPKVATALAAAQIPEATDTVRERITRILKR